MVLAFAFLLAIIPASECLDVADSDEKGPEKKDRRFCARMQDAEQIRIVADKVICEFSFVMFPDEVWGVGLWRESGEKE